MSESNQHSGTPESGPAEPFDAIQFEGITAYAEAMAKALAPDDPEQQAKMVEGMRAAFTRKAQKMTADDIPLPGLTAANHFYASTLADGTVELWDFFNLVMGARRYRFNSAPELRGQPYTVTIHSTRSGGLPVELDRETSKAFAQAPPGAELIEYVALRFQPDLKVANLRTLIDHYLISVLVNGVPIAATSLMVLPIVPPMSGRFVFRIGYGIKPGDRITAELNPIDPEHNPTIDQNLIIETELSITGKLSIEAEPREFLDVEARS